MSRFSGASTRIVLRSSTRSFVLTLAVLVALL